MKQAHATKHPLHARLLAAALVATLVSVTHEQSPYRVISGVVAVMTLLVLVARQSTLEDNIKRPYSTSVAWLAGCLSLWLFAAGAPEFTKQGARHALMFGVRAYLPLLGFVIVCATGAARAWYWVAAFLVTAVLHAGVGYLQSFGVLGPSGRLPRGLTTWHTNLGEVLAIAITLAWAGFWGVRSKWRWTLWAIIALCLPLLIFTSTRSAYLTVAVGIFLSFVLASRKLTLRRLLSIGGGMVALAGAGIGLLQLVSLTPIVDEKFTLKGMLTRSVSDRALMNQQTRALFTERPWLGWGTDVDRIFDATRYTRPHNIYFEMLACAGVVGFLLWASVTVLGIYGWWRVRRTHRWLGATGLALMAELLLGGYFHHSMIDDPLMQTYWAALVGCGVGYACATRPGAWLAPGGKL